MTHENEIQTEPIEPITESYSEGASTLVLSRFTEPHIAPDTTESGEGMGMRYMVSQLTDLLPPDDRQPLPEGKLLRTELVIISPDGTEGAVVRSSAGSHEMQLYGFTVNGPAAYEVTSQSTRRKTQFVPHALTDETVILARTYKESRNVGAQSGAAQGPVKSTYDALSAAVDQHAAAQEQKHRRRGGGLLKFIR